MHRDEASMVLSYSTLLSPKENTSRCTHHAAGQWEEIPDKPKGRAGEMVEIFLRTEDVVKDV